MKSKSMDRHHMPNGAILKPYSNRYISNAALESIIIVNIKFYSQYILY